MGTNQLLGPDLPSELYEKPLALIGFTGLDIVNNATHKTIWEAFSSNRRMPERVSVRFKLIENCLEFPSIKPRSSYDWYNPKGILKRNWMHKHLNELPSVVVVFFDLDWNEVNFNEKILECSSRVQSLRAALEGRSTRIVVVLIQNNPLHSAGEDALTADRVTGVCASCDLNSGSLFVLPVGDHLQGFVIRLETAFFDFAQNYYHNKAKHVKSHKDHMNKNTHQFLFVRHQFKMGFFYELKEELTLACKHYTNSYNNLLEIRIVDSNAFEVRTIAGFINYKICRLMFSLNLFRDAISQFKSHVDRFKVRMGFHELFFEHWAWLSKQHQTFGDLFNEAIKMGLKAVQTQHPGVYYEQAAQYAILRKKSCQELCTKVTEYPHEDPLESQAKLEFFGQRPWTAGRPVEPQLEMNGIRALQFLEQQVNHSNIIIGLYGLANTEFKTYRCPRTRRNLVLLMAEEYYDSKDFGKALTLYTLMLIDFRPEQWWKIISQILDKALKCAFFTANLQDYILLTLEILNSKTQIDLTAKKRIHENLSRILRKKVPYGDSNLPHELIQQAIIAWNPIFTKPNLSLNATKLETCLQAKARFVKGSFEVDEVVRVEVFVRNSSGFLFVIEKVFVEIEDVLACSQDLMTLQGNGVDSTIIEFAPFSQDINKTIRIKTVKLLLGNELLVELNFNVPEATYYYEFTPREKFSFDHIQERNQAVISGRNSKLKVNFQHDYPALLGEWYEVLVQFTNEEFQAIEDLKVEVSIIEDIAIEFALTPQGGLQKAPFLLASPAKLQQNETANTKFFLRAHKSDFKTLNLTFTYNFGKSALISTKYEEITLEITQPFDVKTKFSSNLFEEIDCFFAGEEFVVEPTIYSLSPWPILIESTTLELFQPNRRVEETKNLGQMSGKMLEPFEAGSELYLVACDKTSSSNVTLGQYIIKWKRIGGQSTTSLLTIQGLRCDWMPLQVKVSLPAYGLVQSPLMLQYSIANKSQQIVHLNVTLGNNEDFMYAGYRQTSILLLPEDTKVLNYNLYPLSAGTMILPKLLLTNPEGSAGLVISPQQIESAMQRTIPTHLAIMPKVETTRS